MKRPEWSSRPAAHELGHAVDQPRAAQPDGLGVADDLQLDVVVGDADALDRALGGAHAAADLRGLEGGAGGRRGGEHALLAAQRDLAVGADVDEEPDAAVAREAGGQHAGHDVAADVGAQRGEDEGRRARVHADAEVAGQRLGQLVRGDREGRHRERLGIDPEGEVHHRRVAADGDLVDLLGRDARLLAHLGGQRGHRLVRARAQRVERVGVHHRGRDARDDVAAEGLLGVEQRLDRERLAGLEVEQRGHHRGGAEVEGERVAGARRVARLDVDHLLVDDDRGDLEGAEGAARRRACARRPAGCGARGRRWRRAGAGRRSAGPPSSAPRARRSA